MSRRWRERVCLLPKAGESIGGGVNTVTENNRRLGVAGMLALALDMARQLLKEKQ